MPNCRFDANHLIPWVTNGIGGSLLLGDERRASWGQWRRAAEARWPAAGRGGVRVRACGYSSIHSVSESPTVRRYSHGPTRSTYSRQSILQMGQIATLFDPFSRRAEFFLLYLAGRIGSCRTKSQREKNDDEKKSREEWGVDVDEAKTNTEKWQRKPADSRGLPSSAAAPTAPVTALSSSVCCTAVGRPSSPLIAAGACSLCLC